MGYKGVYILVKLGKVYSWENNYPTYEIEKIKNFANHVERSDRLDRP